jgi:diguanylate cyclase (GGDEF)-like protein/PAS domain S-box-containing protein
VTEDRSAGRPGLDPATAAALAASSAPDGIVLTDAVGAITWANDAVRRLLGHDPGELVGTSVFDLLDADEQHLALQAVTLIGAAPDKVQPAIYHPAHADGSRPPIEINGTEVTYPDGSVGLVLVVRDANHHAVLTEGVSRLTEGDDLDAVVADVLDELTGRWPDYYAALLVHDGDDRRVIGAIPDTLRDLLVAPSVGDLLPWEAAMLKGEIVPCLAHELPDDARVHADRLRLAGVLAVPVPDPEGPRGCLVLFAGVDAPFLLQTFWRQSPTFLLLRFALARRYWVARLQEAATTDPLTGLANRAWFFDVLESRTVDDATAEGAAVLYVDLDDFKPVNDRFGHTVGDVVLTTVADRLRAVVRPGDVVSRIGGDELAVLCATAGLDAATHIAERLLGAVAEPIDVDGQRIAISASIGIAVSRLGERVDDLVERADRALYEAKRQGKRRWVVARD